MAENDHWKLGRGIFCHLFTPPRHHVITRHLINFAIWDKYIWQFETNTFSNYSSQIHLQFVTNAFCNSRQIHLLLGTKNCNLRQIHTNHFQSVGELSNMKNDSYPVSVNPPRWSLISARDASASEKRKFWLRPIVTHDDAESHCTS